MSYYLAMPILPNVINYIPLLIAIVSIILYLREYNIRKSLEKEGKKVLENFKEKGLENLHQSIQKSQEIIGEAELEAVKVVSDSKFETTKIEKEYDQKITELLNQSEQTITKSQEELIQFMANLQKRATDFEQSSQAATQQRINQLFERLEVKLSDFLITTEQKTTSSIELELKGTRELIDAYKIKQFKLIDDNIIAMMEQTLNIVLGKKLNLKDQMDLVYEALEKAKSEKTIV